MFFVVSKYLGFGPSSSCFKKTGAQERVLLPSKGAESHAIQCCEDCKNP